MTIKIDELCKGGMEVTWVDKALMLNWIGFNTNDYETVYNEWIKTNAVDLSKFIILSDLTIADCRYIKSTKKYMITFNERKNIHPSLFKNCFIDMKLWEYLVTLRDDTYIIIVNYEPEFYAGTVKELSFNLGFNTHRKIRGLIKTEYNIRITLEE